MKQHRPFAPHHTYDMSDSQNWFGPSGYVTFLFDLMISFVRAGSLPPRLWNVRRTVFWFIGRFSFLDA